MCILRHGTNVSIGILRRKQRPAAATRPPVAHRQQRSTRTTTAAAASSPAADTADAQLQIDQHLKQQRQVASSAAGGLGDTIEQAFLRTFSGPCEAPRVLDSWRRLRSGDEFRHHWPGLGLQQCASYLEGLPVPPQPFPDLRGPGYEWLLEVEAAAGNIMEEFERIMSNPEALEAAGNSVWVPAAREDALSYGPDWRTLVLQDRGDWDKFNAKIFSRTRKILESIKAPTLEVFFAKQNAGTGIASHTDDVNFVQTSHLGLRVPDRDCWVKCGDGPPRKWEVGKCITMDTSYMHETWNGTDQDRYVLIMRHWHPGTTPLERVALQFLFDCVDRQGTRFAENKALKQIRALGIQPPAAAAAPAAGAGGAAAAAAAQAAPKTGGRSKAGGGKGKKKK